MGEISKSSIYHAGEPGISISGMIVVPKQHLPKGFIGFLMYLYKGLQKAPLGRWKLVQVEKGFLFQRFFFSMHEETYFSFPAAVQAFSKHEARWRSQSTDLL